MPGERTPPFDLPSGTPVSVEQLEMLLTEARNSADGDTRDSRSVLYASEIALGILRPGYIPKQEAVDAMRRMLSWLDDEDVEDATSLDPD